MMMQVLRPHRRSLWPCCGPVVSLLSALAPATGKQEIVRLFTGVPFRACNLWYSAVCLGYPWNKPKQGMCCAGQRWHSTWSSEIGLDSPQFKAHMRQVLMKVHPDKFANQPKAQARLSSHKCERPSPQS